ncbi:hypothetical protein HOO65_090227 [Ceratocystis lukuohia]|uniref:Uncharacterized protein n=1 Tax=Ceratocystis lukuohia TaxID=2019550 RepID=A0ABR4M9J0_9PEZI
MRLFSTLLPLALSLVGFSQATILEDHGYLLGRKGKCDAVFGPTNDGKHQLVNGLVFHPLERTVIFRVANNEKDPEREGKLDLSQIYNALAETRNCKPEDVDWVISEVQTDEPTSELIGEIRKNRELGPMDGVTLKPGSNGWNEILNTKHFQHAAIIKNSPPDIMFIRTVPRETRGIGYHVHALFFHFSTPETSTQKDEVSIPTIDKRTENSRGNLKEELEDMWELEEELATDFVTLFAEAKQ